MKKNEVLNQLKEKKISVNKAYDLLYGNEITQTKLRKAHFIKLKFDIKDEKFANALLKTVFLFPVPMFLIKWVIKLVMKKGVQNVKGMENVPLTQEQIIELVSCKGILVDIDAHDDAKILIKTI